MGLDLGRCPISSPSHTSTKNGKFTSQSTRTRLDEMQCAYECKTYEFSWFIHSYISSQYDSIPCNHHVNTSILHALTYHFSHTIHSIQFKQYHASNIHGQFQSKDHFRTVQNNPTSNRGLSKDSPIIEHSIPFLRIGMHGHSRPHNSQTIFMDF